MAYISKYSIDEFCFPCILFEQYHEIDKVKVNKSVSESYSTGYALFYDNNITNYYNINRISLVDKDDIINEFIFKMIHDENSRREKNHDQISIKDKIILHIDITNIGKEDFENIIDYSKSHNKCMLYLHGKITFDHINIKLNDV